MARRADEDASSWDPQHSQVEADDEETIENPCRLKEDESMEDVDDKEQSDADPADTGNNAGPTSADPSNTETHIPHNSLSKSELFLPPLRGQRKLDWHYLYKQRRKLEENWSAGRFINFQLPHPEHEDEAHVECIYTIQYCGKYLVSGSRDRSLRIWDLDTRRLVGKPLYGHSGSVLCLQFDASEEEDIIVSGSSDTDVIVWRFSTGEKITRIKKAHKESVLNLRFDRRYLVTCSKDKTIKVFNRHALEAKDKAFPSAAHLNTSGSAIFPQTVVTMAITHSLAAEDQLASALRPSHLPPYSLLMTLKGHCAAVNAIQVYGDLVVSASGDRTIKIFNLQSGACTRSIAGHSKGIACVQFDGRRIVSGSSDNSVKIFDQTTGAEVACLVGHQFLVRTVQAAFGDLPGSEEDDEAEARKIDQMFFEATSASGGLPQEGGRKMKLRNDGGRDPQRITAYGAALPPGGGGSRWARIVSGSYDETVIIWRRDAEGKWVIGHRLKQEDAARAAGGPSIATSTGPAARTAQPTVNVHQNLGQAYHNWPAGHITAAMNTQIHPSLLPNTPNPIAHQNHQHGYGNAFAAMANSQAAQSQANTVAAGGQNPASGPPTIHSNTGGSPSNPGHPTPMTEMTSMPPHWQSSALPPFPGAYPTGQLPMPQLPVHAPQPISQPSHPHPHPLPNPNPNPSAAPGPQTIPPPHLPTLPAPTAGNPAHPVQPVYAPPPQAAHTVAANATVAAAAGGPAAGNARVFKLQFDARRIICCSQDPKIVGWDFAAGERAVEEASRFFEVLS